MATTAHAAATLDIPVTDDMDLHSDSDLDFDGGDIDVDLDPAQHQDDDVSLKDAVSVSGLDVDNRPIEQDDFMVDHDDVIDDFLFPEDDAISGMEAADVPQVQTLAPPDEDLIDYSDEEGPELQENYAEALDEVVEAEDINAHVQGGAEEDVAQVKFLGHDVEESSNHDQDLNHALEDSTSIQDVPQVLSQREGNDDVDHTDSEDGGVLLHSHHESVDNTNGEREHQHHKHAETVHDDYEQFNTVADDQLDEDQSSDLQSVTVNYAGNDLWLFKAHDLDGSGDWLLEDVSIAKSRISELFQACRTSLGDDVSNEHEIGFRFDHLHNLELYEDNTACVAVSLERLVGLYHKLQEQDGIPEPESFYISLLFRPRFVTLLSDIAKHAEDGNGYAALNAAVAAGDTHFTTPYSGSSTGEPTELDEDEPEDTDDEVSHTERQLKEQSEHESEDQNSAFEEGIEHPQEDDGHPLHAPNQVEVGVVATDDPSTQESSNHSHFPTDQAKAEQQPSNTTSPSDAEQVHESDARREQKEDDLIDYSDDEDAEDAEAAKPATASETSPASSTVQGDESPNVHEVSHTADFSISYDDGHENHDITDFTEQIDNVEDLTGQSLDGNDNTTQEGFSHVYDADEAFSNVQVDGEHDQSLEPRHDGNADYAYADLEYQNLDEQVQPDFLGGQGFDDTEDPSMSATAFAEPDNFLDFNDASDWVQDQETRPKVPENPALMHDEIDVRTDHEASVGEHDAAAVTSDADRAATSSKEVANMSPQGQKRSIDEAGHGADDALDSTGIFYTSFSCAPNTDLVCLDTKRPRM